ncbi:MAG TPA: outer membrane beta-barrel protein [Vicinamibacterales bacterium]|nr:outer membrane beta-barrel protein [Vicinamibacterales bacterium]
MKHFWVLITVLLAARSPDAAAQTPASQPLVRADASAALGWFNARERTSPDDDDWYSRSMFAGVTAGWHWTDHLKTEVEAGFSSQAELYGFTTEEIDGSLAYVPSRTRFETSRVAVIQQYQFFRNAWFHPFAGAGLDVTWKTSQREEEAAYTVTPRDGLPHLVRERRILPERTTSELRPVALVGFKAYMTPRTFFRSDLRLTLQRGLDEAVIRFGFGVDVPSSRLPKKSADLKGKG